VRGLLPSAVAGRWWVWTDKLRYDTNAFRRDCDLDRDTGGAGPASRSGDEGGDGCWRVLSASCIVVPLDISADADIVADADALFGLNLNGWMKPDRAGGSALLNVLVEPFSGSAFKSSITTGGVDGGVDATEELMDPDREGPPPSLFTRLLRLRNTFMLGSLRVSEFLHSAGMDMDEFRESDNVGSSTSTLESGEGDWDSESKVAS